ncbi:MAG: hypothetical protein Kow0074_17110 [Candidatus Zixiibacteriota bacterium]
MRLRLRTPIPLAIVMAAGLLFGFPGSPGAQTDSAHTLEPLQPRLDEMKAGFEDRAPKETIDLYEGAIRDLRESGILDRALNVGDTATDFALPNAVGDTVALSDLLSDGPVVVVWYRGGW